MEKFTVLDREDIAEPLERILPYIQSQNADVETLTFFLRYRIDLLRLLNSMRRSFWLRRLRKGDYVGGDSC